LSDILHYWTGKEACSAFYIALIEKIKLAENVYGADALPRSRDE
jgi:hypothetical protein